MLRTAGLGLASLLLGLVVSLACLEGWARAQPAPRVQEIAPSSGNQLRVLDGAPVWRAQGMLGERLDADCVAAGGPTVALAGSSIFYGAGLGPEDAPWATLKARRGGCVVDLSEPGFTFQQQIAVAEEQLPAVGPDVIVWEIWANSPNRFSMVGDRAYNFGSLARDAGGVPDAFGAPPGLNRWLFSASASWRYLVLGAAPDAGGSDRALWARFVTEDLSRATALAARLGARLAFAFMPPLDRPFTESAAQGYRRYAPVYDFAEGAGIPTLTVAEALRSEDVEALRGDLCCHYNADGARALGGALAAFLDGD